MKMKKRLNSLLILLILITILSLIFLVLKNIQIFRGKAERVAAEIDIDASSLQILPRIWPYFAQGGEETESMLAPVKDQVINLGPKFIRIDHIYDFYQVATRDSSGNVVYNWSILDERIKEILAVGALPLLSLSYLPPALVNQSVTDKPNSYPDWQNLIQSTIERYSGRQQMNIANIYYEVWNEPDHFGKMSPVDYGTLYLYASKGASAAKNVNPFRFGGPAVIGVNRTWLNDFLGIVLQNKSRLDFLSWHSYGTNPQKIKLESETIDNLANYSPFKGRVEKLVTEWGPDSEIVPINDSLVAASHAIAAVSQSLDSASKLFAFELKDGLDPKGNQFWGRWGLLTHQKTSVVKKPRYSSFILLNRLYYFQLSAQMNNDSLFSINTTDGKGNYSSLITFYPWMGGKGNQGITIKYANFLPGEFVRSFSFLGSSSPNSQNKFVSAGTSWEELVVLEPYSSVLVTYQRTSSATTKAQGITNSSLDKSAHIISPLPALVYPLFSSTLDKVESGQIAFDFKPLWNSNQPQTVFFWENRVTPTDKIYAYAEKTDNLTNLIFAFSQNGFPEKKAIVNLSNWENEGWHHLIFSWDNSKMELSVTTDGLEAKENMGAINQVKLGKFLFLGSDFDNRRQSEGEIDNVEISVNHQIIYHEDFNEGP